MTISLVTGGAGFIGSHIVEQLIDLGHEVVVVDNEYSDNENFYWRKDTYNVKIDITDKALKNAFTNVDYVFHLAAEARIGPSIENPVNAVNINTLGTCNVLQCARDAGVKKVMYSSTSSGYGLNPSPTIVSFSPAASCLRNIPITGAYCPFFGALSPNTLKYRNITVLRPKRSVYILHIFSPATFDTEYGFKQSSVCVS